MKKKILLLAAIIVIAGCQREEMQQARSYSAVTEGFEQSRTSLDEDNRVLWSAGDEIAIFENKDVPSRYQVRSRLRVSHRRNSSLLKRLSRVRLRELMLRYIRMRNLLLFQRCLQEHIAYADWMYLKYRSMRVSRSIQELSL